MRWNFINANTISEMNTGFTIRLISGTWESPQEVSPDGRTVTPYMQAKMLRMGLEFARSANLVPA